MSLCPLRMCLLQICCLADLRLSVQAGRLQGAPIPRSFPSQYGKLGNIIVKCIAPSAMRCTTLVLQTEVRQFVKDKFGTHLRPHLTSDLLEMLKAQI